CGAPVWTSVTGWARTVPSGTGSWPRMVDCGPR
ncbi:MAG: hypothetical protein AVDCRST_MAG04-800, partial [uncultured Acetobacteraceae bacterium]